MKAWFVTDGDDQMGEYVWAPHQNRARQLSGDQEYLSRRATRVPKLDKDDATEGPIPRAVIWEAGFYWACSADRCESFTTKDDGGQIIDGYVYCPECAAERE